MNRELKRRNTVISKRQRTTTEPLHIPNINELAREVSSYGLGIKKSVELIKIL